MTDIAVWFGLKKLPFDKELKTSHVIETKAIKECTARLEYIKKHGGIMLLTGDPGVGKTIALRRFVDNLNENLYRAIYTPLSTLHRTDLFRHINHKLGLESRMSKALLYTQIQQEFLESLEHRGRKIVLILDEAQLLQVGPLQELRLLTNFKMDSHDAFILILSGQSELRRTMDFAIMEPLSQRLSMRFHMPPLSLEETSHYVVEHLKLAGTTEAIFGKDAFSALHELSHGIPRRVGALALESMTYAMFSEKRVVDASMVLSVKSGD